MHSILDIHIHSNTPTYIKDDDEEVLAVVGKQNNKINRMKKWTKKERYSAKNKTFTHTQTYIVVCKIYENEINMKTKTK